MKTLALLILIFAANASFASVLEDANTWIKSKLNGTPLVEFKGKTTGNRACSLYLSDKDLDMYFVVVAYSLTADQNDYIGVVNTQSEIKVDSSSLLFASGYSWGNDSTRNSVVILTDKSGRPTRATGISNLKSIACDFN